MRVGIVRTKVQGLRRNIAVALDNSAGRFE